MTPLPWSPSSIEDFKNCPRSFHEKRVLKRVKDTQGPEAAWGEYVHKAFEHRQGLGAQLPDELEVHESYMRRLEAWDGLAFTESKVAFDRQAKPCNFFDQAVWFRGVIDFKKVDQHAARLVDYKTGKPHTKFRQLASYALHTFALHPVNIVDARYYWTVTQTETKKVWGRAEIPELWAMFLPDLKQYVEAFKTDTWQPRQSGLCNGWCPVIDCEFWKAKKRM